MPAELRWTGDDAQGRWSLVAGAQHDAWDPLQRDPAVLLVAPFQARQALAGDRATGRVAFEAQRAWRGQRLDASFFASRAALSLRDEAADRPLASIDEHWTDRTQHTRFGMALGLTERTRLFGLPGDRTLGVRLESDNFDAREISFGASNALEHVLRRDRVDQARVALEGRQSIAWGPDFRIEIGGRIEQFHARTEMAGGAAMSQLGHGIAPSFEATWSPLRGAEMFLRGSRGREDFAQPLAAINPLNGRLAGFADPDVQRDFSEAGVRLRSGPLETRASAWRTRAAAELAYSEAAVQSSAGPVSRQGLGLGLRYQPLPGLDLRADALFQVGHDVASARVRGAGMPQAFGSAGATLRMSKDVDARLSVSYLGAREESDGSETHRSTTLVNAQLVRWFGRTTRVSLDVFNVFNQHVGTVDAFAASRSGMLPGTGESFLTSPAEPRGFLVKLRTHF